MMHEWISNSHAERTPFMKIRKRVKLRMGKIFESGRCASEPIQRRDETIQPCGKPRTTGGTRSSGL
jgi:hypothetical protein